MLAACDRADVVMRRFVDIPWVAHVYARGLTKTLLRLDSGIDANLRVVPAPSFGTALLNFTGSRNLFLFRR